MGFHCADFKLSGLRDFFERHFFHEPEEKHCPLAIGKLVHYDADRGGLLAGDHRALSRRLRVGDDQRSGIAISRTIPAEEPGPEGAAAVPAVVRRQVDGDSRQPGGDAGLAAEARALAIRAEKTFLGKRIRSIGVAKKRQQKTKDALLVLTNDSVKVLRAQTGGGTPLRNGFKGRVWQPDQRSVQRASLCLTEYGRYCGPKDYTGIKNYRKAARYQAEPLLSTGCTGRISCHRSRA